VTKGQLPQRAGLPGLNGGGTAAAVPPVGIKGLISYLRANVHVYSGESKPVYRQEHHWSVTNRQISMEKSL